MKLYFLPGANRRRALFAAGFFFAFCMAAPPCAIAEETGAPAIEESAAADDIVPKPKPALEYLCAWVSLASYEDRVGLVARNALADRGWVMQPYREENEKAAAKYCFMKAESPSGHPRYILSVTGTADMKDVRTDLSMSKVPFSGSTPEEFAAEAGRTKMSSAEPLVHRGFLYYTETAFFTHRIDGRTFGEELRDMLAEDPEARLCVTGHSLGGAVAVLLAARLAAMGVPSRQLDTVTFGAPAVGNRAFVREYGGRIGIDRIAMSGDPVLAALQSIDSGYTQMGEAQRWSRPRGSERFAHDMTGYVDVALRHYIDATDTGEFAPDRVTREEPRVFLAVSCRLDDAIKDDEFYIKAAAASLVKNELYGVVESGAEAKNASMRELCAMAKATGCRYVLMQRYESKRIRNERDGFTITLSEILTDTDKNVMLAQSFATYTRTMTPIIAALYDEVAGREARSAALMEK